MSGMSDYDEFKLLVTSIMDNWYGLQVRIVVYFRVIYYFASATNNQCFAFHRQLFLMAWVVLLPKLLRHFHELLKK